ncbi:MAG TPA: helix-turn-helix domain-containing protein [Acidimicrobiales bacterium]
MSAAVAAEALDISLERVRQLIRDGRLDARQVSGRWLVDPDSVDRLANEQRGAGRPWAAARAWGLLALAADRDVSWLAPAEIRRLQYVLADRSVAEMASQLRRRADRRSWYVHPGMIENFLAEDGVVAGGARASGQLRDSGPIDVYIAGDVLDRLVDRYVPDQSAAEPNLIARIVRGPWPFAHGERLAWPEVAAVDLLERGGDDRARRVAHELLRHG